MQKIRSFLLHQSTVKKSQQYPVLRLANWGLSAFYINRTEFGELVEDIRQNNRFTTLEMINKTYCRSPHGALLMMLPNLRVIYVSKTDVYFSRVFHVIVLF